MKKIFLLLVLFFYCNSSPNDIIVGTYVDFTTMMKFLDTGNISEIEKNLITTIEFKKNGTFKLESELKIKKKNKPNPTFKVDGKYLKLGNYKYKLLVEEASKDFSLKSNSVIELKEMKDNDKLGGYQFILEMKILDKDFKRIFARPI